MGGEIRRPFQGALNIVRFNWPYYVFALIAALVLGLFSYLSDGGLRLAAAIFLTLLVLSTIFSLLVSWYVYDLSGLYKLRWLDRLTKVEREMIVNINAGFDETSALLEKKFSHTRLIACDFYDPKKHTAPSIKRARKTYPPFPGTRNVSTFELPFDGSSVDKVFAILSAHEIRDREERKAFFKEIYRVLALDGDVVVVEHLRDTANWLAFNLGALHFYSRKDWLETFNSARLEVKSEAKLTPFITAFFLTKNGDPA